MRDGLSGLVVDFGVLFLGVFTSPSAALLAFLYSASLVASLFNFFFFTTFSSSSC